jgi:hemerythrin-like metal-binding protein
MAMEEQNVGSRHILEAIDRLRETTKQVKEGSVEMLNGSRKVISEGKNLADATHKITDGVNEIASGAEYIDSAVKRVHNASDDNKEHIKSLSGEVERFKVLNTTEYVLDKTFTVGFDLIDDQHSRLFSDINSIVRACVSGNVTDFKKSIQFLEDYVDKHFTEEEGLQRNSGYPDYPNHKKIHDNYKALIAKLAVQWLATGPSEAVLNEVRLHCGGWLINHIKAQDVKLGAFLNSKK